MSVRAEPCDPLTHTIPVLRKAPGEQVTGQQYVQTVPRVGYRFAAAGTGAADSGHSNS